jgi:hypothetical protein
MTLPGLATSSRRWLKIAGYMAVVCAVFTMILGLYLWIFTLKTKEDFAPLFSAQSDNVKSLMQTSVSISFFFRAARRRQGRKTRGSNRR